MLNLLGWRFLAGLTALVVIVSGAVGFLANQPNSLSEFLALFSKAGLFLSLIVLGLGQSPIFPMLCRWPPLKWVVPDIHGQWKGSIVSNWATIASKHGVVDSDGNPSQDTPTPVTVNIRVRLIALSVELISDDQYQNSKTLSYMLGRNSHEGFHLSYIFRSFVPNQKASDEQSFLGAALFDIAAADPTHLRGSYWTNRNWKAGLNTAGAIELERV